MAIIVWIVLEKTTFGYELKAVGLNKDAARYAGINEKKNIILSMTIAGALAGFGAGLLYLSGGAEWNPLNTTNAARHGLQRPSPRRCWRPPTRSAPSSPRCSSRTSRSAVRSCPHAISPAEIADMISGIIIYLCAFAMLFRSLIARWTQRTKSEKEGK